MNWHALRPAYPKLVLVALVLVALLLVALLLAVRAEDELRALRGRDVVGIPGAAAPQGFVTGVDGAGGIVGLVEHVALVVADHYQGIRPERPQLLPQGGEGGLDRWMYASMMAGVASSTRALCGRCSRASAGIRSTIRGQYCAFWNIIGAWADAIPIPSMMHLTALLAQAQSTGASGGMNTSP
jgi:hypothetical protein